MTRSFKKISNHRKGKELTKKVVRKGKIQGNHRTEVRVEEEVSKRLRKPRNKEETGSNK